MISETAAEIDLYQDVVMDHKRAARTRNVVTTCGRPWWSTMGG